ncbi:MAG: dihydroorotate dehydrogenase [Candidatus Omnitrophica bacterium]|nr:dihydroorotate dehydrogenase [Candidatus Omnitrophota bacterium]
MKTTEISLTSNLGNLKLNTPVICASGTFGFGEELCGLADFKSIGAITTKTITLEPRAGNLPPRIYETRCGVLNSVGLENPGLEIFITEKLPRIKKIATKFIISVGGFSFSEYETIVKALDLQKDIKALEINLSCPNLQLKKMVSQNKTLTYKLLSRLRSLTNKVLIAKVTPEVTNIVDIAAAVKASGADFISLVNTFYGMSIDVERLKPRLGNIYGGYSGRAIKPMSLYRVWQVYKNVDIPIIAGGGIEDSADAIEFFLAGASFISLGTINMVFPNKAQEISRGLKKYMNAKRIKAIGQIRGKAHD